MRHAVSIQAHVIYDGRQLFLNLMSQYKESVDRLTVSVVRARREWYGAGRATAERDRPCARRQLAVGPISTMEQAQSGHGRARSSRLRGAAGRLAKERRASWLPTTNRGCRLPNRELPTAGTPKRRASLSRTSPPRTMTKRLANDPVSAAASSRLQRSSARSQAEAIPQKRSTASKPSSKVCAGACLVQPTR